MKNLYNVIIMAAAVALVAACTEEVHFESVLGEPRRYSLSFEESTKTIISETGDKRHVNWNNGDLIKYYTEPKQTKAADATVITDGGNAYTKIPRGRSDEFINAVYGATQIKSSSSTADCINLTSPIKSVQHYTSFAEAHICAAFCDDVEDYNLRFHNVAPILKFSSSSSIYKVVVSGNDKEIINAGSNGDVKITNLNGSVSLESTASGSGATNLSSITVNTNGEEADFYIAILPVTFESGICVDCYDADNELVFTKKTGQRIKTISETGSIKVIDLGEAKDWTLNNPPGVVDLGLSVKWASFNLGATKPEEYGDYFAWGETEPKDEYKWSNYDFENGTGKNGPFSKYVTDESYGTIDHKTVLDLTDDAAHVNWGGDWRMPSKEEVEELENAKNCSWVWTKKNGVNGYRVTSKKSGFVGNSIFLPANGIYGGAELSDIGTMGNYWSSSLSDNYSYFAVSPFFSSSSIKSGNCARYFGLAVRPVCGAVVPVSSIEIPETLNILVGKTETLAATVQPENATYKGLTWTTSDPSVATVDAEGKVSAVSIGNATISCFSADAQIMAECVVTVNQLIQSITLDITDIEMYVGDDPFPLTARVYPDEYTDKSLSWASSNTSVATVDEEGNVTAIANGTATITATAKDGGAAKATCAVTVYTHVGSVSLNKSELSLYAGRSETLVVTVSPTSASDKSVKWSSSTPSVATVESDGKVTGIKVGGTTIIVTTADGGYIATCEVTVTAPDYNGHEYIDLGLPSGLKWATCNVGASAPEEYGDYFSWGETQPKEDYSYTTYKWLNGGIYGKLWKYFPSGNTYGVGWCSSPDNKLQLDPDDDAAVANWGGSWRMPTVVEQNELFANCSSIITQLNGVSGMRLTSNMTGYTDKSIFLPFTGIKYSVDTTGVAEKAYYWSSSLNLDEPYGPMNAHCIAFFFTSGGILTDFDRHCGFPVRAVSE